MGPEVDTTTAVIAMALTTYATRIAGPVIMAWVPFSANVERFLEAVSGSVLVALIAPLALAGGVAAQGAVVAAVLAMFVQKNAAVAMVSGVVAAVAIRALDFA